MDAIPAGFWATAGPVGLLSIAIAMVLFGLLIPRRTYIDRLAEKDERIAEKNVLIEKLGSALDKRDEQFTKLVINTEKLIANGDLTIHLLEEIRKASQQPDKADLT